MHKLKSYQADPAKRPSKLPSHERLVISMMDSDDPAIRSAVLQTIKTSPAALMLAALNSKKQASRTEAVSELDDPDALDMVLRKSSDPKVVDIAKNRLLGLLWACEMETMIELASAPSIEIRNAIIEHLASRNDSIGLGYISVTSEYADTRRLAMEKIFSLNV
ncbi:hypothetical protein JXA56_01505 [Candidatus Micrarchaeota archaeon]|nr:hypothetical protein [Candidatus Micrarchaeota archaeon]